VHHAAVVIPIVNSTEPKIVFVRRAGHLRRNPGQIAFPGGIIDIEDGPDRMTTALREFEEEMGMPRERVRIVDRLDDVVTLALSVTVTPYVGILEPPVAFQLDRSETDAFYEVPLATLYAPGALRFGTEPVVRGGETLMVPSWLFDTGDLHVWGATARMLHEFVARYGDLASLPLQRA
jgi:8-oxo-dGTP pyrophosphatase MutT (NUDIX family)